MIDELKQTIKNELVKLPKEHQEVINTFDWETKTGNIGKQLLINEDEVSNLQNEVALVLVGIADEDNLVNNIEKKIGTSKNEAEKLAYRIDEEILIPMYKKLEMLIRESPSYKTPKWYQRVGFILSGGNYSVFLED